MKHDHDHNHRGDGAPAAVVEVDIKNVYGGSDYAGLEVCFCGLARRDGLVQRIAARLGAQGDCARVSKPVHRDRGTAGIQFCYDRAE